MGRCAAPVASSMLPLNGAASGSSSVTIAGLNFGAYAFTPSAGLVSGSELCSTTSWSSGTAVQCHSGVPTMLGDESHMAVTINNVVGTRGSRFTFDAALVSVTERNSPLSGGAWVTVMGLNFGFTDMTPSVSIARRTCETAVWVATTSLLCHSSAPVDDLTYATVTVHNIAATVQNQFSFDSPVMSAASVDNNPRTGFVPTVTVSGLNFGLYDFSLSMNQRPDTPCVTTIWVAATSIICDLQESGLAWFTLTVADIIGTNYARNMRISFDSPVLSFVHPSNAPSTGAETFTVTGMHFWHIDRTPTTSFMSDPCKPSTWKSATSVLCVPNRVDPSDPLYPIRDGSAFQITIAHQISTMLKPFSYDSPVSSSIFV